MHFGGVFVWSGVAECAASFVCRAIAAFCSATSLRKNKYWEIPAGKFDAFCSEKHCSTQTRLVASENCLFQFFGNDFCRYYFVYLFHLIKEAGIITLTARNTIV